MEEYQLAYSHYGWRARIGLLVPCTNVVMEPEMNRMAPEGVSIHAARLAVAGSYSSENPEVMIASVGQAAVLLKKIDPSVMVFGCTSSSFIGDEKEIRRKIEEETGVPAITSSGAILQALRSLGLRSIAVATPYPSYINNEEKDWLESEGFKVLHVEGLDLGKTEQEFKLIGRQPAQIAYRIASRVGRSNPDGIFISCGNFATLPIIETLESDLGIPVVTSGQATMWYALRTAGLKVPVQGCGVLMIKC